MILYNINLIFVFICLIISRYEITVNKNKTNSYILNILAFLSLWALPALRNYSVGSDSEMYANIFSRISSYTIENSPAEIGYLILNKVTNLFNSSGSNQIIFITTSFISLYLISRVIFKYSRAYELSFFLFITMYFYYDSFNLVRQFIAIGITFYAIKYIFSKEFYKYLFMIIISFLFHQSAIIMIPFYFILQIKIPNKVYGIILSVGIIGCFCINKVLMMIFTIIPRYQKYASGELSKLLSEGSHWIHALTLFLLFIVIFLFKEKLVNKDEKNNIYINALFFSVILQILGIKSVLFSRVVYYLSIYSVLLIPNFLDIIYIKKRGVAYLTIIVIYFVNNFVLLLLNQSEVLPYIH